MKSSFKPLLIFLLFGLFLIQNGQAQTSTSPEAPASSTTIFQVMEKKAYNKITLKTNFTKLTTERRVAHQLETLLTMENDQGQSETMEILVELRGKTRRKICDMPPIKLIFPKDKLEQNGLSKKGDKLKLVVNCPKDKDGRELLLKEYWAYRFYNQVTDYSFKTRLVQVYYIDTGQPDPQPEEQLAFILESEEELAIRHSGKDEELWGLSPEKVDRETFENTLLFNYMIGNDDWDLPLRRNLCFIKVDEDQPPFVVPYDFDFSGLVAAPYSKPNEKWGAKTALERVAMGSFTSREALHAALERFLVVKDAQLADLKADKWLSAGSKQQMRVYLIPFYRQLKKTKQMEKLFLAEP